MDDVLQTVKFISISLTELHAHAAEMPQTYGLDFSFAEKLL